MTTTLNIGYGKITVLDKEPALSNTRIIYLEKIKYNIPIAKSSQSDQKAKNFAQFETGNYKTPNQVVDDIPPTNNSVGRITLMVLLTSGAIVLRYFVIIDILINFFGKINVELSPKIDFWVNELKKLQIPQFTSVETTSPIDDGGSTAQEKYFNLLEKKGIPLEETEKQRTPQLTNSTSKAKQSDPSNKNRLLSEGFSLNRPKGVIENAPGNKLPQDSFFSFVKYRRGSRKRLIVTNQDMFIMWGQNGLLAAICIVLYLCVWFLKLGESKKFLVKIIIKVSRVLL